DTDAVPRPLLTGPMELTGLTGPVAPTAPPCSSSALFNPPIRTVSYPSLNRSSRRRMERIPCRDKKRIACRRPAEHGPSYQTSTNDRRAFRVALRGRRAGAGPGAPVAPEADGPGSGRRRGRRPTVKDFGRPSPNLYVTEPLRR